MEIKIVFNECNDGDDLSIVMQTPSVLADDVHGDTSSIASLSSFGTQMPSLIHRAKVDVTEVKGGYDSNNKDNMADDDDK